MYVVKIVIDDQRTDFKAFDRREDAEKRFLAGQVNVWEKACDWAGLYLVENESNVRRAVEAVKNGSAGVKILKREPQPISIDAEIEL